MTSADYRTTKRITNTASQERDLSFSEDGRTLYYSAERDGHWGIWRTSLSNKDDKYFTYATEFKEELFSDEGSFSDENHLSREGAEAFTEIMADVLCRYRAGAVL